MHRCGWVGAGPVSESMGGALPATAELVNGRLTRGNRLVQVAQTPRDSGSYSGSGLWVSMATKPEVGCFAEMCSTENSPVESAPSEPTSVVWGVPVSWASSRMISGMTGPWLQSTADLPDFIRLARTSAIVPSSLS